MKDQPCPLTILKHSFPQVERDPILLYYDLVQGKDVLCLITPITMITLIATLQ